jgi:hypothetical protein
MAKTNPTFCIMKHTVTLIKDTRTKKIADSALFKNVQVRAVPASSVPTK